MSSKPKEDVRASPGMSRGQDSFSLFTLLRHAPTSRPSAGPGLLPAQ